MERDPLSGGSPLAERRVGSSTGTSGRAVRLIRETGKPIAQVARDPGMIEGSAERATGRLSSYAVTLARNAVRLATFRSICSSRVSLSWSLVLEAVNFLPRVYSEQARSPQR